MPETARVSQVGSVAEEAARLIEAFVVLGRSPGRGGPRDGARDTSPAQPWDARGDAPRDEPRVPPRDEPRDDPRDEPRDDPRDEPRHDPPDEPPARAYSAGTAREAGSPSICPECGSTGEATPAECRVCPVCHGIALLRSVRPETIDWLADLAASVATGLHDIAARSRAPSGAPAAGAGAPGCAGRATVQDIPVDDERDGEAP